MHKTGYSRNDLIGVALDVYDDDPHGYGCDGGPHCPRCRLAVAKGLLDYRHKMPDMWGDEMLRSATSGLPHRTPWTKTEADAALEEMRQ